MLPLRAISFGVVAALLLMMEEGGISALQSVIVIAAVPVSLLLLPLLWTGPRAACAMAREQGIATEKRPDDK
ncbi:BCCT family transporter [Kushneria avicenniae]|uniref:BCCT family transporter n=1 Tax=Kushneria avicenniae TaxID=402385 RepID=UPI00267C3279